MCKSASEGGQRCAAHTREKYASAIESGDRGRIAEATVQFASTEEGHQQLNLEAERLWATGAYDAAASLDSLVQRGHTLRAANKEAGQVLANHVLGAPTASTVTGQSAGVGNQNHLLTSPNTHASIADHRLSELLSTLERYDLSDPETADYVTELRTAVGNLRHDAANPAQETMIRNALIAQATQPVAEKRSRYGFAHVLGAFSH